MYVSHSGRTTTFDHYESLWYTWTCQVESEWFDFRESFWYHVLMDFNNCKFCGRNTGKRYNLFCNHNCHISWQNADKVQRWLDGWNPLNNEIPEPIRRYLFEEADYRCTSVSCCVPGGWSEINPKTGKVPVTIDHIDGNGLNHRRENLRVLCPNCHSLTSTYGNLNRGNGRKYRYAAVV